MSDGLSSTAVVVTSTGVVAAQLFAPDGQARWAGGTMPTSYAFTGQRADSTTGLDYYGARYYDPVAGTFTSADTVSGKGAGLNRYGYVSGNPETLTDPTGHMMNRPCFDGEECAPIKVGVGSSLQDQCVGSTVICNQIIKQYGDQRTVLTLFTMLRSEIGAKFVDYIVAETPYQGRDQFITWDLPNSDDCSNCTGYTDWNGNIHLDPAIFSEYGGGVLGYTEAAGVLTHEAVESYFARAYGLVTPASQHMDYVAEWFAGEIKEELNSALNLQQGPNSPLLNSISVSHELR